MTLAAAADDGSGPAGLAVTAGPECLPVQLNSKDWTASRL
jgi:hypothetical protein